MITVKSRKVGGICFPVIFQDEEQHLFRKRKDKNQGYVKTGFKVKDLVKGNWKHNKKRTKNYKAGL